MSTRENLPEFCALSSSIKPSNGFCIEASLAISYISLVDGSCIIACAYRFSKERLSCLLSRCKVFVAAFTLPVNGSLGSGLG